MVQWVSAKAGSHLLPTKLGYRTFHHFRISLLSLDSHFSLLIPCPCNHWPVFHPSKFSLSRISYKWHHTYFSFLASLVQQNVFKVLVMLLRLSMAHSFLLLMGSISLDESTIIRLFIHQLMETWVVSRFSWLWVELLRTFAYTQLYKYLGSLILEKDCCVTGYMLA